MKINLIDIDGKTPNLALMKMSAHWKAQGAEVVLNSCAPSESWGSDHAENIISPVR